MSYLIISVFCFVLGSLVAGYFFRRHYRENERRYIQQEKELQARKQALREIMYLTHHRGINPIAKRIRGAVSVIRLSPDREEHLYWLTVIETEAMAMETEVLNNIKEFEHLQ